MKVFRLSVAGALVLFAITAAFGMSVKSDYEKTYDFSRLRTFAFKTERDSNDPLNTNTIEAGRIQSALAAQLEANGFTQATENPDFIVASTRTKQKTSVQSTGLGVWLWAIFGYGRGFGWDMEYRGRTMALGYGPDI
jgi:hypothetical protein